MLSVFSPPHPPRKLTPITSRLLLNYQNSYYCLVTSIWFALVSAGVIFVGYKLITDPYSIAEFITPNKSGRRGGSTGAGPDIRLGDNTTSATDGLADAGDAISSGILSWLNPLSAIRSVGGAVAGSTFSNITHSVGNALNPFNYGSTPVDKETQFKAFLDRSSRPCQKQQNQENQLLF